MLKVRIVAVGKIKEKFYSEAVAEYAKRLSRFCEFRVVEVAESTFSKEPNPAEAETLKRQEGERILAAMSGFCAALDLRGEQKTSEDFSALLSERISAGVGEFTFVIGGSYGLDGAVLKRADVRLSFGKLTFPHQLMRVVLCEQLYRAFMIRAGSAYHK